MTGTGTALGAPAERREGRQKVTGGARYAAEHLLPDRAHAWPVPAAVARGRVTAVDTTAALELPGVLTVLTHENAPRLTEPDDPTLAVLQEPGVPHRGWTVALVVARSPEEARAAAAAVRLDVPTPSWMRAPGECPGVYALESAVDELATALGTDPVRLRFLNEPEREPDSGKPFSSRHLTECLREGARRFGWDRRDPRPRTRAEGPPLLGTGVAAATYPVLVQPSAAEARALPDGTFVVRVNATDIGTGARTVLAQVAADALRVPLDRVRARIGDSDLPSASLAGGSSGTASWGWAVHDACTRLADRLGGLTGRLPDEGVTAHADTTGRANTKSPYSTPSTTPPASASATSR